jgi:hypothetical protein
MMASLFHNLYKNIATLTLESKTSCNHVGSFSKEKKEGGGGRGAGEHKREAETKDCFMDNSIGLTFSELTTPNPY